MRFLANHKLIEIHAHYYEMAARLVLSNQLLKTGIEFGNNHHLHLAYNSGWNVVFVTY